MKDTVIIIIFAVVCGILLGVLLDKQLSDNAEVSKTIDISHVSKLVQTGLSMVKDFYGQDKLMLSYSLDGLPQSVLLDAPFEETLPKYQAYLRELGDFSILGE